MADDGAVAVNFVCQRCFQPLRLDVSLADVEMPAVQALTGAVIFVAGRDRCVRLFMAAGGFF